jgi:hypothetical protein
MPANPAASLRDNAAGPECRLLPLDRLFNQEVPMMRSALPLSLAAAFGLSACGSDPNTMSSRQPAPTATASQAQTTAYRAGSGVVQSVTAAPRMGSATASAPVTTTRQEPVAAAGATATAMHRLAIRMDDGRVQYVDMAGGDIPTVGTRVQLTPDHQIIRQ